MSQIAMKKASISGPPLGYLDDGQKTETLPLQRGMGTNYSCLFGAPPWLGCPSIFGNAKMSAFSIFKLKMAKNSVRKRLRLR